MEEIEAKFLGIATKDIEAKLAALGAQFLGEKTLYAISFDFPGYPLNAQSSWVRLRTDGAKTMLAYKQRLGVKEDGGNDDGMKEIETSVGDFETTRQFLLAIGMVEKFAMEKRRRSWKKDLVAYDIDQYPKLDAYLEIETDSWNRLASAAQELGLDPAAKKICSTQQIYKEAGINEDDFVKMTFSEWIPRGLSA